MSTDQGVAGSVITSGNGVASGVASGIANGVANGVANRVANGVGGNEMVTSGVISSGMISGNGTTTLVNDTTTAGNSIAGLKASHVSPKVEPMKVAMPESPEALFELLRRYRELEMTQTHESEKLGILKVLRRVNKMQEEYEAALAEEERLWESNNEDVDVELLRDQIIGLQLMSKDLDLPVGLQFEFGEEEEKGKEEEKDEKNRKLQNQIEIPLDDYEEKAKRLGIEPRKPQPDPAVNAVGTSFSEQQLYTKLQVRLNELEQLPGNIGFYDSGNISNDLEHANDEVVQGVDEAKVRALVELKGLRLLPFQKYLRNKLVVKSASRIMYEDGELNKYGIFRMWKRGYCVRAKEKVAQTALLAERLHAEQRKEQRREQQRSWRARVHEMAQAVSTWRAQAQRRRSARVSLGKAVHHFQQQAEREEARRKERFAKQRLQALKSNDEEAYIKLLDETKDQRITHLLKQTNSFLGSLATAVRVQQQESQMMEKEDKGAAGAAGVDGAVAQETGAGAHGASGASGAAGAQDPDTMDYYEVAHHIKEAILHQPSILVGGKLKEYQLRGLEWMVSLYNNHLNGILADEMGLGKTIQSIALVTYLIEAKQEPGKFLIIVPLSTITNWTLEFERWAPSVKKIVYKGSQQQRKALSYGIRAGDFTVLLTTYEYVIRDRNMLAKFRWAYMIIDEGHRLKNTQSKLFQTLTQYYRTRNRLILTGTPLQNSLPELWALLNFILPKVFNSVKSFDEWFNTPFENTGHQERLELSEEESLLVIRRLHKVLRPFLLRRLKKDVEKDLPDKVEKVVKCKLSALQARVYKQLLEHNALFVGARVQGHHRAGLRGLNNKVMQLRKICNHPFVFEEVEDAVNPGRLTTDLIWRSSGKFELLDRILPKLKATKHRTLLFFQMTQVMDIMEDFLRLRGIKYLRLDGATKADDRQAMLKLFNAPDSEYFCFLLSTRAGGLGLNLQTADTVVIFDTDWNPHQDLQAQDRAHRIGQKHEVRIYRLITEDSVEEVILQRAHQKLDIDGKVIQAGRFDNKSSSEEQEAFLRRMIEQEKKKAMEHDTDEMNDDEMNEILARSDAEKALFRKMDDQRHQAEKNDPHPRLMADDELPEIFKKDMAKELEPKHVEVGRRRHLKKVIYDDGLTEDQWLQALDDDNDTVEAAAMRKRASLRKRRSRRGSGDKRGGESGVSGGENESGETDNDSEPSAHSDYDSDSSEYHPPSKRRRTASRSPSVPQDQFVDLGLQLIKQLRELTDDSGRKLATLFNTLPSRRLYPDYYQIIHHPVAFRQLKHKLAADQYADYHDFRHDLLTMFANAKLYNQEGSLVYQDAQTMEKYSLEKLAKIESRLGVHAD